MIKIQLYEKFFFTGELHEQRHELATHEQRRELATHEGGVVQSSKPCKAMQASTCRLVTSAVGIERSVSARRGISQAGSRMEKRSYGRTSSRNDRTSSCCEGRPPRRKL